MERMSRAKEVLVEETWRQVTVQYRILQEAETVIKIGAVRDKLIKISRAMCKATGLVCENVVWSSNGKETHGEVYSHRLSY